MSEEKVCHTCRTGGWPSLWLDAVNRKKWLDALCPKHTAEVKKMDDDWDAMGKAMKEIDSDPVKKAEFEGRARKAMTKGIDRKKRFLENQHGGRCPCGRRYR